MSNWFRLTPDGSLDREYLATCAIYRCVARYGMSKETAIQRLCERWSGDRPDAARKVVEIWFRHLELTS